ncbi:hypothetical protein HN587_02645 [Candidatus Woesearchaeota archaeon]|mgnify:CR=1 FL=1|jgi:hypothetical protein|nr:hypothetical protein [Candidatus Woesearchaeota archaeon]
MTLTDKLRTNMKWLVLAGALATTPFIYKYLTSEPFERTGQQTSKGYEYFEYSGKLPTPKTQEGKLAIADEFDAWDSKKGNNCKNTGWSNVRVRKGKTYVVAGCDFPADEPDPEPQPSSADYTKINYDDPKLKSKINAETFEPEFLSDLEKMCERLDMNAMGLISVMDFETGGTFSPKKKNPKGSATGLIQFISRTARSLGTTTKQLRKMTQRQQLKYVEKYFKRNSKKQTDYANPVDIALTIFYPAAVGKGDWHVIARRGSKAYRQNAGLDKHPKDGKITAIEYTRNALNRGYTSPFLE